MPWGFFEINSFFIKMQLFVEFFVNYVRQNILEPVLRDASRKVIIDKDTLLALQVALEKPIFQASDLAYVWANTFARSRNIRAMLDAGLIAPVSEGARKYYLKFAGSPLMVSLIYTLYQQGFLPESMMKN